MTLRLNDKSDLNTLRALIDTKLKEIEDETGVRMSAGRITYESDGSGASIKVTAAAIKADGSVETFEARDFKGSAFRFGMKPDDLGRKFRVNGTTYEITGAKSRSPKFPILGKRIYDGKSFKFPAPVVVANFLAEERPAPAPSKPAVPTATGDAVGSWA